jgi:hypothetical protein
MEAANVADQTEPTGCFGCLLVLSVLDGVVLYILTSWCGVTLPPWVWWADIGAFSLLGLGAVLVNLMASRKEKG